MKNLLKHNVKRCAVHFGIWLIESINKVFHKGTANTNPIKRNQKGGQDMFCDKYDYYDDCDIWMFNRKYCKKCEHWKAKQLTAL